MEAAAATPQTAGPSASASASAAESEAEAPISGDGAAPCAASAVGSVSEGSYTGTGFVELDADGASLAILQARTTADSVKQLVSIAEQAHQNPGKPLEVLHSYPFPAHERVI